MMYSDRQQFSEQIYKYIITYVFNIWKEKKTFFSHKFIKNKKKPLKSELNVSGSGSNLATFAFPIASTFLMSGILS